MFAQQSCSAPCLKTSLVFLLLLSICSVRHVTAVKEEDNSATEERAPKSLPKTVNTPNPAETSSETGGDENKTAPQSAAGVGAYSAGAKKNAQNVGVIVGLCIVGAVGIIIVTGIGYCVLRKKPKAVKTKDVEKQSKTGKKDPPTAVSSASDLKDERTQSDRGDELSEKTAQSKDFSNMSTPDKPQDANNESHEVEATPKSNKEANDKNSASSKQEGAKHEIPKSDAETPKSVKSAKTQFEQTSPEAFTPPRDAPKSVKSARTQFDQTSSVEAPMPEASEEDFKKASGSDKSKKTKKKKDVDAEKKEPEKPADRLEPSEGSQMLSENA
ncbi:hypothetical protein L596_008806 [Steinernema carpocapsae]|uniref:Mid2 domain-containing protein n=1 Tax=Steinernema carpocapsae TaxID=34508 RepID=A0A4U5PDM3_STECR|nr:hypothetical protein L596_008806 [Steinernema carpocapsae]